MMYSNRVLITVASDVYRSRLEELKAGYDSGKGLFDTLIPQPKGPVLRYSEEGMLPGERSVDVKRDWEIENWGTVGDVHKPNPEYENELEPEWVEFVGPLDLELRIVTEAVPIHFYDHLMVGGWCAVVGTFVSWNRGACWQYTNGLLVRTSIGSQDELHTVSGMEVAIGRMEQKLERLMREDPDAERLLGEYPWRDKRDRHAA